MKVLFGDVFTWHKNHEISVSSIYGNPPKSNDDRCDVYSCAIAENKIAYQCSIEYLEEIKYPIFKIDKEYILINRKGNAGTMRVVNSGPFCLTDVYALEPKRHWQGKINLQYVVLAFQELVYSTVTSRSDNGNLQKPVVNNLKLSLPLISEQNAIVKKWQQYSTKKENAKLLLLKLNGLLKHRVSAPSEIEIDIGQIFQPSLGKEISEVDVYNHSGTLPLYGGNVDDKGCWKCDEKWFKAQAADNKMKIANSGTISWVSRGKAGSLIKHDAEYGYTNNCGVLSPKIQIDLDWFFFSQRHYIQSLGTAKGGVGVMGLNQMSSIKVNVPFDQASLSYDLAVQKQIGNQYRRLEKLRRDVSSIIIFCEKAMLDIKRVAMAMAALDNQDTPGDSIVHEQ